MESTDPTQLLPEDVLVAILRRLPPHGLAAARCVCKAWHAVIDARRLLDLFPPSLAGLFINFWDLEISEFFFRPQRDTDTAVSGNLDYVPTKDDTVVDHCNGLLLFCAYVVNPATRRWAPLPPRPRPRPPGLDLGHIVFDPSVSPHYEVLNIPTLPGCTTGFELQMEWPPSPFIIQVFSSTTGIWEEKSFARRGDAIGTVSQLQQRGILQKKRTRSGCVHVIQELQAANLLAGSNSWHHATSVVTRCFHRAEQRVLDLGRGISPEQAQDILHHSGITRQCDLAIACEAKLLGHPEELAEDHRATRPIGRVHEALDRCRGAALHLF